MSDSKLFDTKAAAEYIGHSAGTLHNWRVNGGGPAFIKPRKKVFYRKKDLDAWLEANCMSQTRSQARLTFESLALQLDLESLELLNRLCKRLVSARTTKAR